MSEFTDAWRAILLKKALAGDENALEELCNERLDRSPEPLEREVQDLIHLLAV